MHTTKTRLRRWLKERSSFLAAIKSKGGKCQKCGEDHIAVLDFHHRDGDEKEAHVSSLVRKPKQKEKLAAELLKCDLLCSNCHRKEHFDKSKWDAHAEEIERRATGWKPKRDPVCKRVSKDEISSIRLWIGEGLSFEKMANRLGRNPSGMRRSVVRLYEKGLLPEFASYIRPKRAKKTRADQKEAKRLWEEGHTVAEIALLLGCGIRAVYSALRGIKNGEQESLQVEVSSGEPQAV
jgi:transposase